MVVEQTPETDIPTLSIIIVSWRVRDMLRDCLRSVLNQGGLPAHALQIIVVDNASGDGTVEMLRSEFPTVQCIESRANIGFGAANTLAWQYAAAPLVLLLNPDTLVHSDALRMMVVRMNEWQEVWALGCRLLNGDGSLQRWTGGHFPTLSNVACHYLGLDRPLRLFGFDHSVYLTKDSGQERLVDWVSGACMLLRRERIPEPLFDPIFFMYGEDTDLCWRIRRSGGKVLYSPSASITHFQGASMNQQTGVVLLTSLIGIRTFYRRQSGPVRIRIFDVLTVAGFALRWSLYSCASLVSPRGGWGAKARSSRDYLQIALALMSSVKP